MEGEWMAMKVRPLRNGPETGQLSWPVAPDSAREPTLTDNRSLVRFDWMCAPNDGSMVSMSVTLRKCEGKEDGWEVDVRTLLPEASKLRERRQAPVSGNSAARRWAQ